MWQAPCSALPEDLQDPSDELAPRDRAVGPGIARGRSVVAHREVPAVRYVAAAALPPGFMRLERMDLSPETAAKAESPEFPGRAISALAADPNVLEKSGSVFTTPALARDYGFTDLDGKQQSAFWDEHWAT